MLLAKVDELGRTAWLVITLLSFWVFWPLGLAVVGFLAGSGRLRRFKRWSAESGCAPGRWFNLREDGAAAAKKWGWGAPSSGNQAFDSYREETLRRLEEERQEFQAFLERLRRARDKAEFDEFMAERRRSQTVTPVPDGTP